MIGVIWYSLLALASAVVAVETFVSPLYFLDDIPTLFLSLAVPVASVVLMFVFIFHARLCWKLRHLLRRG